MEKQELWVQNRANKDVMISDLGVKVCMGKTINIYTFNPHLTEEQIQRSLKSGSLYSRLGLKLLVLTKGPPQDPKPAGLDRIKESDQPLNIKKLKSSAVVMEPEEDVDDEGDFSFADYGVDETIAMKKVGDSIVAEAMQDAPVPTPKQQELDIKQGHSIATKQPHVFVDLMNTASDSIAEIAEDASPTGTPYVVVTEPMKVEARNKQPEVPKAKKTESGGVVMEDVSPEPETKSDVKEAVFDAKVATKTENGAVVMKFKEKEAPKAKKTKKKAKSSKKK